MQRRQGIYWIITLPEEDAYSFIPGLRSGVSWLFGQLERGETTGFLHWQFIVGLNRKGSLRTIQGLYPGCHAELTRSDAAESYCGKLETRVKGPFELGVRPFKRNSQVDWDRIWDLAKSGDLEGIPANVRVPHYR